MKPTILWVAMIAIFLAEGALAQTSNAGSNSTSGSSSNSATTSNTVNQPQATANSNQSTNAVSGSSSYGNVGNTTTNTMTPTANSNANAQTASQSNSTNAGNAQTIIFNQGPAPTQTTSNGRMENVVSGETTSNVNSTSRSESVISGEQTVKQVLSGEQTVRHEYSGTQTIKNVPSINAAPLTSSNDTCMGSFSAGVSVPGLGVTGGSTYTDEHCKRIKMSRELWNKGMKAASLAIDCMDRDAREALELTGFVCPQTLREQRAAAAAAEMQAASAMQYTRVAYYPPPLPAEALAPQPQPVVQSVAPLAATVSASPAPAAQIAPASTVPEPIAPATTAPAATAPVPATPVAAAPVSVTLPPLEQAASPAPAPDTVATADRGDDSVVVRRVDPEASAPAIQPATR